MVNASIVTVRCLVCTCEKHLPPELYLQSHILKIISTYNIIINVGISHTFGLLQNKYATTNNVNRSNVIENNLLTWRTCQTCDRWRPAVRCRTTWLPLRFPDSTNKEHGTDNRYPGTTLGNVWPRTDWFLRVPVSWLPDSRRLGTRNIRQHSIWYRDSTWSPVVCKVCKKKKMFHQFPLIHHINKTIARLIHTNL